ncbi:MAG: TSCPD domain-containing protein [Christensenellales bacterium]
MVKEGCCDVFTYYPKGVCSQKIQIELAKDHTIQDIQIIGGCDGNLKGVRAFASVKG